jgi:hypothetical protein
MTQNRKVEIMMNETTAFRRKQLTLIPAYLILASQLAIY